MPARADPTRGPARLRAFTDDLASQAGLAVREEVLRRQHPSYSEICLEMLPALVKPDDEPLDAIVVALSVPEVDARRSVASHLNELAPGDPLTFAVSDQGTAAPFTALHIAQTYRRAALMVVEQGELAYETRNGAVLPRQNTAVALLLGESGTARLAAVRQHLGISRADLPDVVRSELSQLDGPAAIVARDEVAAAVGLPHLRPPDGLVCTALWWVLAEKLIEGFERLVLLEHDPELGYLSLAALDQGSPR